MYNKHYSTAYYHKHFILFSVGFLTGSRTPVSRVTGGDTYHYTITELPEQSYLILAFVTVASQRLLREVASSDLELESQLVNGQVVLPSVVL